MSRRPNPIFLERRSYRLRRVMDAARLMPILGAVLWLVPVLWGPNVSEGGVSTSRAMLYIFLVWAVLSAVSFILARWLDDSVEASDEAGR